ncbi:septum formation initiator family protein [Neobacillus sp. PS3-12]|jgi:cell division protein DivIC|uniref:FtsB family cell division protein n=1 Tax=Neobacillus sp. PS3-12 TaxID=3070677 RepID=UPI0027DFB58A|nr:septum formation initiator family protein [Neobacillus sp. PS3-12]WML55499.1 septum formation initiator family protein [Neobacillus sp. PS3-12]
MAAVQPKNVAKIETSYVQQQEYSDHAAAKKKKKLYRRLSVFFVFALFVAYSMVSSILSQASTLDEKVAQKKQYDKQLTALKNQQNSLKQEISNLNDDDYIAKLARKEYFLSNKDEIIFNIPDGNKEK